MVTDWQVTAHHLNPVTTGLTARPAASRRGLRAPVTANGRTQHEPSTAREIT
jgi:hypothetical protein